MSSISQGHPHKCPRQRPPNSSPMPQMTLYGCKADSHLPRSLSHSLPCFHHHLLLGSAVSPTPHKTADSRDRAPKSCLLQRLQSWPGQPAPPGPLERCGPPIPSHHLLQEALLSCLHLVLGGNPSEAYPWGQGRRRKASLGQRRSGKGVSDSGPVCTGGAEGMAPPAAQSSATPQGRKASPSPPRRVLTVKPSLFTPRSFQGLATPGDVETALLFAPAA